MRCVWQVEIDDHARRVLARHWPHVRRWDDVRTFPPPDGDWGCDLIAGGFPCQDISNAGRRAGINGKRSGLWSEFARIIRVLRPQYVLVENVPALLVRGMDTVLGDLAACGYDAQWDVLSAAAVGAPHLRERLFLVAYHASPCRFAGRWKEEGYQQSNPIGAPSVCEIVPHPEGIGGELRPAARGRPGRPPGVRTRDAADADGAGLAVGAQPELLGQCPPLERSHWWSAEPDMGGTLDGFSAWLDGPGCPLILQSHKRIMTYGIEEKGVHHADAEKVRPKEVLSALRDSVRAGIDQREIGRPFCLSAQEVLFAYLCKLSEGSEEGDASLARAKAPRPEMRGLRTREEPGSPSRRSEREEQYTGECADTLHALSRLLAHDSEAAWAAYRRSDACPVLNWESGISRVADGVPARVDRLRGLGNAVVPQIAQWIGERIVAFHAERERPAVPGGK